MVCDSRFELDKMTNFVVAMIRYSIKNIFNKYPLEHVMVTMLYQMYEQFMHDMRLIWEYNSTTARIRLLHDCIIITLGHGIYITEFSIAGPYTNKAIEKKTRKKKKNRCWTKGKKILRQ